MMTKPPKEGYVESLPEKLALRTTGYIGSPTSLIIHTLFFIGIFSLSRLGYTFDQILLILTTIVSLEAIYLSIFIQITVNHQAKQIREVGEDVEEISKDIDDIQEDVEEISEDVEEISKDIDVIQEDVEEISEDVEEISKDIDDIQEDVEEISEDVEEISKDIDDIQVDVDDISKDVDGLSEDVEEISDELEKDDAQDANQEMKIKKIESTLEELLREIKSLPRA